MIQDLNRENNPQHTRRQMRSGLIVTPFHEVDETNLNGEERRPRFNPARLTRGFAHSDWNLTRFLLRLILRC